MNEIANGPGTRVGAYQIERQLGAGGMGSVHLARHVETGEMVALKLMHPETAGNDVLRRRFVREARATMALTHPNIIRIVATFEHAGQPVIAMEVLHGLSLKDYLRQETKLSVEEAAGIFQRVVSAVGSAHAIGLIHRDLKPDNVFLTESEPWVKVLDFGIAKLKKGGALNESSALTKTGVMIGTPYYMAPEQAFGEKTLDHRADIWSLGMMLHEALSGVLPTRSDDLEEIFRRLMTMDFPRLDRIDAAIPAEIADLVVAMLKRIAEDRLSDLHEVQAVLARYAPEISAIEFEPAAPPLSFDDPSSGTGRVGLAPAAPAAPSQPLKLTPGALKLPSEPRTAGGTIIVEGAAPVPAAAAPPAPPAPAATVIAATISAPSLLASTVGDAVNPPSSRAPIAPPSKVPPASGSTWMWILAATILIACIVVLLTQLR